MDQRGSEGASAGRSQAASCYAAPRIPSTHSISVEEIIANSFRDYHVKGFDYICLRRSPFQTVKLYFFDGDVSKLPEVVNPHDHRYDFKTVCVAGAVENRWYRQGLEGPEGYRNYQVFEYETPLNGGGGFRWSNCCSLALLRKKLYRRGGSYLMNFDEIHTIRMVESETVLCVVQFEDKVASAPTHTYSMDKDPPSLTGLYNRFTSDEVLQRISKLRERVPGLDLPIIF